MDTLAFDQTNTYVKDEFGNMIPDDTPIRYETNGTTLSYCYDDIEDTYGEIMESGSFMPSQKSCKPNAGNAGNYYSWPASAANGSKISGLEPNSICPKGWQLTTNTATDIKSYYYLIRTAYNIQDSADIIIRILPLSYIRSGLHNLGALNNRGSVGYYWSAVSSNETYVYGLVFSSSGTLSPQGGGYKYAGFSVRCVSR